MAGTLKCIGIVVSIALAIFIGCMAFIIGMTWLAHFIYHAGMLPY
jgi:hypothetical protein